MPRRKGPLNATSPSVPRSVEIHRGCRGLRFRHASVARVIRLLDTHAATVCAPVLSVPAGTLSLAFLPHDALARIHDKFLADPSPTDVITFPGNPAEVHAGEICVSVDAARLSAGPGRHAFARELTLYIVHGWLHLAGFDDHAPSERRRMRAAERRAMAVLSTHSAIPDFSLARGKAASPRFRAKPGGTRKKQCSTADFCV